MFSIWYFMQQAAPAKLDIAEMPEYLLRVTSRKG